MEDVAALKVDAWLLPKARAVTDLAVVILALLGGDGWIHLLDAFRLETWHTSLLPAGAAAWMPTLEQLVAAASG
jgi:hypothetical protein